MKKLIALITVLAVMLVSAAPAIASTHHGGAGSIMVHAGSAHAHVGDGVVMAHAGSAHVHVASGMVMVHFGPHHHMH